MQDDRFRFGALPLDEARTEFRLWAPTRRQVVLETDDGRRFPLEASPAGWFEAVLPLPAGTGYRYRVEGPGEPTPIVDPAARALRGSFGVVVDASTAVWQHDGWRARPWHEAVLCKIDASAPGGFAAATARLPGLAGLGFTAVDLRPVVQADGRLLPFAPDPARGGPDDFRRLVDAAHGVGLMVVIGGIDAAHAAGEILAGVDDRAARAFFRTACVLQWVVDYRVDGVWLDIDDAAEDIAAAARRAAGPNRRVHLLLAGENPAPLPPGIDARSNGAAARALQRLAAGGAADAPAEALARALGGDTGPNVLPLAASVIEATGDFSGENPAALALLLASPSVPRIAGDGAVAASDDAGAEPLLHRLLRLRAERLMPHLAGARSDGAKALGGAAVMVSWRLGDGSRLVVGCNLGAASVAWPDAPPPAQRIFSTGGGDGADLPARTTRIYIVPGVPAALAELAELAGVALHWSDQAGRPQSVSQATVARVLEALGHPCGDARAIATSLAALRAAQALPAMLTARLGEPVAVPLPDGFAREGLHATLVLESGDSRELRPMRAEGDAPEAVATLRFDGFDVPGYHRIELASGGRTHAVDVAVAQARAFDAGLERAWGTSVQLHALRPEAGRAKTDAGFGDFSALAAFAKSAGAAGAQVVAISPTHAGFAVDASNFSPYAPSSRLFHNVLFIDPVAAVDVDAAAAGIQGDAAAAAGVVPLIDWPSAGATKLRWLREVFDRRAPDLPAPVFDGLRLHATFEALHAHFHAQGLSDWRRWPDDFQNPESAAVTAFADTHADDVRFHVWLQQLAEAGLRRAQDAARAGGMRVGLVADLAIGMSGAGSHAWASRRDVLVGLEIGAPPDGMNPRGQRWGLTGFSPQALVERRFEPFLQTLRAAMRQAGGVRIDHVLGLNRLWLVPDGLPAAEGAYVRYPFRDLVNLLILESHRHRAIVVGEDLGTVPEGFREALSEAGILGMTVLWLERAADGVRFKPLSDWSADAVAMTTTHDLPTAAGWWQGRDIDWRERIGTETDPAAARKRRGHERAALAALVPEVDPAADGVDLAIAAVCRARSALVLVPVEDLLGLFEQPNLPGTVDEHPNWRRRLPTAADALLESDLVRRRIERLRVLRGG